MESKLFNYLSLIQNIDFHLMPYFSQHTLIKYLNEQDNLNNKSESVKSSKKKI